jgi:hypothetical protein
VRFKLTAAPVNITTALTTVSLVQPTAHHAATRQGTARLVLARTLSTIQHTLATATNRLSLKTRLEIARP